MHSGIPAQQASASQRASVQYSFSFLADAPRNRVFELVTPEGERRWAPGWDPRYLTASKLEFHTVFETGGAHHRRIWIIDSVDVSSGHIRYVALQPDTQVATIDVTVRAEKQQSRVSVNYAIVSLSAQNDPRVRDSAPDTAALGEHWRAAFEAALLAEHP